MSWSKVYLILQRELRDQLRDRRTLFTIAVLPLLLYPLLGMTMLQVAQFLQEHPNRVLVIGAQNLPDEPQLIQDDRFRSGLAKEDQLALLQLEFPDSLDLPVDRSGSDELREYAAEQARTGPWDAVLYIPSDFAERVSRYRAETRRQAFGDAQEEASPAGTQTDSPAHLPQTEPRETGLPQPEILVQAARDKSRIAGDRLFTVMRNWRRALVDSTGITQRLPANVFEPFSVEPIDVSEARARTAAAWSKILPFVLVVWALTGAFYPAIDICAGEKERGTLETLLSSPARRSEIVWGKLLTVMAFSMFTSLLNLISMGMTGLFVMRHLPNTGVGGPFLSMTPPPWSTLGWLTLALIPISALFGALALALATMSRSTKEGQYYLMPLLLVSMPLILLAMLPATELNLGTSLIPVTGLLLLLRFLIEGELHEALRFFLPVTLVTAVCCLLAIRWAVDQFNRESVLFRESERFHLGFWLLHLVRDRGNTPSFSEGMLCGVLLLVIRFFTSFVLKPPVNWTDFVVSTLILQIGLVLAPILLMTVMLTKSPVQTLMLRAPTWRALCGAALLAALLHPVAVEMNYVITGLYPLSPQTIAVLEHVQEMLQQQHWLEVIAVMAILPAICEELALRGFVLSGLRRGGHAWVAILVSSAFFGILHGVLQQSISAAIFGLVLGYVAIQSNSIFTVITFHAMHNGLAFTIPAWLTRVAGPVLFRSEEGLYHGWIIALCLALAAVVLYRFRARPAVVSEEEKLRSALERQAAFVST